MEEKPTKEAMLYEKLPDSKVKCHLCYRECLILPGNSGVCRIRKNINGILYAMTYGKASAYNVDPIEKKPFYHFWPGSMSFSFATVGCNFQCLHCCNPDLSQASPGEAPEFDIPPQKIVDLTKSQGCNIISYTYTEPTVFFEYCYDTGILARKQGVLNTFISNGYATPKTIEKTKDFLDGIRIDLKGDEKHYKEVCGGVELDKVLECIKNYFKTGIHLEIITLVIPDDNDNKETVQWMADFLKGLGNKGNEIPWHFTAFFPSWKMTDKPPTPVKTLEKMHDWAVETGMKYVYTGNVAGHKYEHTYCPNCKEVLIKRHAFSVSALNLTKDKKCPKCSTKIPIVGEARIGLI